MKPARKKTRVTRKARTPARVKSGEDYAAMSLAELRDATKEFDNPVNPSKFREMNPAERARWERVRRGGSARGRPRVGAGAGTLTVPVSLERGLVERADAFAAAHGIKRSPLVAMALEVVMSAGIVRGADGTFRVAKPIKPQNSTRKNPAA
jgi:hypothetical protein